MLIDYTYFFGDCSIGQLSESSVQGKINWFIDQYEPEYLQGVLGYETYKAFMSGLVTAPVPQIWLDLLNGKEYNDIIGRRRRWRGLIQLSGNNVAVVNGSRPVAVVVGRGSDEFDPTADSSTTIIPPEFVGSNFIFMQRSFGPFRNDEYSVNGNVLTMLNGWKFSNGDTYFYFNEGQFTVDSGGSSDPFKISPIAYYVYYQYQSSEASKTGGTGEGIINTQNSTPVSPSYKMAKAFNKMVHINMELFDFLYSNKDVYPDWLLSVYQGGGMYGSYRAESARKFLTPINTFGF